MDCAGVAGHLVAYHVGTVTDEERDIVEAHLVSCSACVKTYLALKRAADRATKNERPRKEIKSRLRAEVARAFPAPAPALAPTKERRTIAVLARRIPLYQGIALAAIAAAVALAAPNMLSRMSRPSGGVTASSIEIDSSRTKAASLGIY